MVKEAFSEFEKPSIAIDVAIFRAMSTSNDTSEHPSDRDLQVLLVREKGNDKWQLPGTILRLGETPKDAIHRISSNKVDIDSVHLNQLYTLADNPERDPRGHIISLVYYGILKPSESNLINKQDSRYEWQWFWVSSKNVTSKSPYGIVANLMYDHEDIISDSRDRLSLILNNTDIAFEFVEKEFTINELYSVYKMIVGREIPSFRRIIKEKIVKTEKKLEGNDFRPADLYVRNVMQ
jgi:8-oxo-dGTP diphosphatase